MLTDIDIKIIKKGPEKDLAQLYREAGWLKPSESDDLAFLKTVIQNSAVFVGVFYNEKMIGMGRALSDLSSDAYIQDVTVLKAYRGNGIGKKIIQLLIRALKEKRVDWIGLIAEPGTQPFYDKIGFVPLKGYIPLKYEDH
ncbi:MAG: GNAT family N-acetyltransferase [Desulfobacterales bacterium]|nr:GNAT family N-acetyltransferase [Desulfobacterales bacterium]